ncbi:hypothetical protein WSM22_24780 [Cytophagales bacterium WSM2-2]|nr:hypothetical protein WSM22_24780 [Cytophagales bacterium WSM2-2]
MTFAQNIGLLKQQFEKATHDSIRLRLKFLISDYYYGINQKLAKQLAFESLNYLNSGANPVIQIRAIQNAANRYWEDGEYPKSIALQRKVLSISRKNNLVFWTGKAHHYIGLNYFYTADFDSALYYYTLAKKEYLSAGDTAYVSRVENHTGLLYDQMGDYTAAINQVILSMKMQEKIPGFISGSYQVASANALSDSAFFRSRIHKNLTDLEFETKQGNTLNIAQTLRNVGMDYMNLGNQRLAISYLRNANRYYAEANYDPFLENLGEAYEALGILDSAVYFYRLRMVKQAETGTKNTLAACYSLMAKVYFKQNKFDESLSFYKKALDLHELMNNRLPVTQAKLAIVRVLEKNGRYAEALQYATQALELATKIGALPKQVSSYEAMQRIYQHEKQFDKSLEALLKANELNKKLTEGAARLNVSKLSYLYESERKDKQLLQLKEASLLHEAEMKNRNLLIILAAAVVLGVSVTGFVYYSRFRQKKRSAEILENQNKIIEQQNTELTTQNSEKEILLSEIHHRVKNNLQIISSLINLKVNHTTSETRETLLQLNGRIYSMGLIHEKLYQKESIQSVRLDLYLEELSQYLVQSFADNQALSLEVECDVVEMDVERTMTCGLICNELLTNAMKHAFSEEQLARKVKLELINTKDIIQWIISDNGQKYSSHHPPRNSKSFGLRFVDQLVKSKLGGTWQLNIDQGSKVKIQFPHQLNGKT